MNFKIFIVPLLLSSILGCQSSPVASSTGEALDNNPWSGYITQDCWQSQTVRQLLSEYTENNFSSFDEIIDVKAKIYINDLNLVNSGSVLDLLRQPEPRSFISKAAMIKGFESTAKALEFIKHNSVFKQIEEIKGRNTAQTSNSRLQIRIRIGAGPNLINFRRNS